MVPFGISNISYWLKATMIKITHADNQAHNHFYPDAQILDFVQLYLTAFFFVQPLMDKLSIQLQKKVNIEHIYVSFFKLLFLFFI